MNHAAPAAPKAAKKKQKKAKPAAVEVERSHRGRLAQLQLASAADKSLGLTFKLKGKKNRNLAFLLTAAEPQRFAASVQLLAAALAAGAKLHVVSEQGADGAHSVSELSVHLG